jgi:hypothetical protein
VAGQSDHIQKASTNGPGNENDDRRVPDRDSPSPLPEQLGDSDMVLRAFPSHAFRLNKVPRVIKALARSKTLKGYQNHGLFDGVSQRPAECSIPSRRRMCRGELRAMGALRNLKMTRASPVLCLVIEREWVDGLPHNKLTPVRSWRLILMLSIVGQPRIRDV